MKWVRTIATIVAISTLAGCHRTIDNLITPGIQIGEDTVVFQKQGMVCAERYVLTIVSQTGARVSYVDEVECITPHNYVFTPDYVEENRTRRELTNKERAELREYLLGIMLTKSEDAIKELTHKE